MSAREFLELSELGGGGGRKNSFHADQCTGIRFGTGAQSNSKKNF